VTTSEEGLLDVTRNRGSYDRAVEAKSEVVTIYLSTAKLAPRLGDRREGSGDLLVIKFSAQLGWSEVEVGRQVLELLVPSVNPPHDCSETEIRSSLHLPTPRFTRPSCLQGFCFGETEIFSNSATKG